MFSHNRNLKFLRVVQEYKHVRFKMASKLSRGIKETNRGELLSEILNCNIHTAREILIKIGNLTELNYIDFHQNLKFCRNFFKLSDLIEHPCVLTLQPSLLQHRYFSLKELGFYNINSSYVLRFPYIVRETPKALRRKGIHLDSACNSDILNKYIDTTNMIELNHNLQRMYEDDCNLQYIKEVMNAQFLSAKLECSIGKAHQMLHKYAALRVQSIYNTDQLLNLLVGRYGFSTSKICSFPSVLSVLRETVENFMTEFPEILDVDTVLILKTLPVVLKQQSDNIHKIEAVLKDFNITAEQLICCLKVFLITPDTLYKRLNIISNTEEFSVLQSNKRFLWLVYYFENLNSRLKILKDEDMSCSINMLTVSKVKFDKYVLYKNTRNNVTEAYAYLANVFKISEKDIISRLHYYCSNRIDVQNFSALNCRKVIEYLLLSGVTKEQILNGLEIVFYEIDTVKLYFEKLRYHHACQPFDEWVTHFNLIQLLIYSIEVYTYHYETKYDEQDQLVKHCSF